MTGSNDAPLGKSSWFEKGEQAAAAQAKEAAEAEERERREVEEKRKAAEVEESRRKEQKGEEKEKGENKRAEGEKKKEISLLGLLALRLICMRTTFEKGMDGWGESFVLLDNFSDLFLFLDK